MRLRNRKAAGATASLRRRGLTTMAALLTTAILTAGCSSGPTVFHTDRSMDRPVSSVTSVQSGPSQSRVTTVRLPWDYRVVEGSVSDLVGSDMTITPDNQLLPNDANYATGDQVWTLQYMDAEMTTDPNDRNRVKLSSWELLKSYKDEASAKEDMAALKVNVTTVVPLIGVYETAYQEQTRHFAVIELPTGHHVKQPIEASRYTAMQELKEVLVVLEEIHHYEDHDSTFAKFRGWAE